MLSLWLSRLLGLLGLGLFFRAVWGLHQEQEPFGTYFYAFAWWSYILVADSLIYARRRQSLFLTRIRELPRLLTASLTLWLLFEGFNFVLGNWRYVNLPAIWWQRWLGYLLSFPTVLPAIFQTWELLQAYGVEIRLLSRWRPPAPEQVAVPAILLGVLFLVAPILWPTVAFPFIWLAFIFLLEPFCYLSGQDSLWLAWSRGEGRRLDQLLLAGLICGLFWELFNYWAGAKWIYTLPFFNSPKIFEMPMLGYLGFLPFAWECQVMYITYNQLAAKVEGGATGRRWWLGAQMLFWLLLLAGIDRFTVLTFRP